MTIRTEYRLEGLGQLVRDLAQVPDELALRVYGRGMKAASQVLSRQIRRDAPPANRRDPIYKRHRLYVQGRRGYERPYRRSVRSKRVAGYVETFTGRKKIRGAAAVSVVYVFYAHILERGRRNGPAPFAGLNIMENALNASATRMRAAAIDRMRRDFPSLEQRFRANRFRRRGRPDFIIRG